MQNNIIKNITYAIVGFIALYIVYSLYSNTFTDLNSGKINTIEIRNLLKNIKNEADIYYPDNNHYGFIDNSNSENSCNTKNNFLTNISNNKLFMHLNSKDIKCVFEGEEKILSWSFTVKSESKYYCIDVVGNVIELNNFANKSSCE